MKEINGKMLVHNGEKVEECRVYFDKIMKVQELKECCCSDMER